MREKYNSINQYINQSINNILLLLLLLQQLLLLLLHRYHHCQPGSGCTTCLSLPISAGRAPLGSLTLLLLTISIAYFAHAQLAYDWLCTLRYWKEGRGAFAQSRNTHLPIHCYHVDRWWPKQTLTYLLPVRLRGGDRGTNLLVVVLNAIQ